MREYRRRKNAVSLQTTQAIVETQLAITNKPMIARMSTIDEFHQQQPVISHRYEQFRK